LEEVEARWEGPQDIKDVPRLIAGLYEIVSELEAIFPKRHFTPDGHLVGSLGEVLAAYRYGLRLLPASSPQHDAETRDGKLVQIKATQGKRVALRSEPDHLLVLKISEDGSFDEVFNGPGPLAWKHVGIRQSNGQSSVSLTKLRNLMEQVPPEARLPVDRE